MGQPNITIPHHKLSGMESTVIEPYVAEWAPQDSRRRLMLMTLGPLSIVLVLLSYYYVIFVNPELFEGKRRGMQAQLFLPLTPLCILLIPFGIYGRKIKQGLTGDIAEHLNWQFLDGRKDTVAAEALARELRMHGLLPKFTSAVFGDCMTGLFQDHGFAFHELRLMQKSMVRDHMDIVFAGGVFEFRMLYPYSATTILTRRPDVCKPMNESGVKFKASYYDEKGEVTVFMSDPNAMAALICNRLQDALLDLEIVLADYELSCLLKGDTLFVPITIKDLFETRQVMSREFGDIAHVQDMVDDFGQVLNILDVILKRRFCTESRQHDRPRIFTTGA